MSTANLVNAKSATRINKTNIMSWWKKINKMLASDVSDGSGKYFMMNIFEGVGAPTNDTDIAQNNGNIWLRYDKEVSIDDIGLYIASNVVTTVGSETTTWTTIIDLFT